MLTPLDIQNKEFGKGFRGYSQSEVEDFLDQIIVDYEKLYKENKEFKEKISMLNDQLNHYDNIQDTLNNTLVVAQKTAEEVNLNAKNEAEQIIKEANQKAKSIINEAHSEVIKIQEEYENIKKEMLVFKTRFKTLIKSQLETIDVYFNDVKDDIDI